MDIHKPYEDSNTSWVPDPKDSMPHSPPIYSPQACPPTVPTCTQHEDVFDGVVSTIFVDTIKAAVATLLDVVIGEVYGVTEAFLHELKEAIFIHEKLKEIRQALVDDSKYKEALVADVVTFWLNKPQENMVNIITSTTVNITNADHKDRISLDRTTGSLELWNLGLRDQGEYRVSIIPDGALELQGATTLDVYVLLSAATINSSPATLIAGISSTNLTCEAAGNISCIQWIKDGLPLSPSNNITFSADNRTVYLSPVQDIDNGEYECLVSNPVSNRTASHNLTVNFGPQNISVYGPIAAPTGYRVTLSCSADSIPPATFTWMFNRTETGVNNTLYVIERMEA
ncbi:cell adhesion molecule CEACAM1-like, partial [Oncorhynchus clarkii lewisi]|uniref:cell adhesion molecule CEACAM1-like n=1 Tax=Oncorhynchus clarkii lewisi TaxID=490388 RepID=UPI0039B915A8